VPKRHAQSDFSAKWKEFEILKPGMMAEAHPALSMIFSHVV
jgi:hypothetical protein